MQRTGFTIPEGLGFRCCTINGANDGHASSPRRWAVPTFRIVDLVTPSPPAFKMPSRTPKSTFAPSAAAGRPARALGASRSASCCFDRGDVDLFHFHHRLERALRGRTIRIGRCFQQYAWGDLPG
jgi:hypothetical protein